MSFLVWFIIINLSNFIFGIWGCSLTFSIYLAIQLFKSLFITRNWINLSFFYGFYVLFATVANLKIASIFANGVFLSSFPYARPELFDHASLVWALGNFVLLEAFALQPRVYLPTLEFNLGHSGFLGWLFLGSVALLFRSFWLPFSLPGAFGSILDLLPLVGILMHSRLAELQNHRGLFLRALFLTALATGYAVLFAYLRISMVIPGLVFLLGMLSARGQIRVLLSPRLYPFYVFLFLFSAFFITFGAKRSQLSYGLDRITELQQAKSAEVEVAREDRLSAFERTSTIGQLSAIVGLVKDHGHYMGRASMPLLTALIPRFLWPEKPPIALGVWFALEIGAALKTETWYNNSINMTIPGHLYLEFGWVGLILGCWLIGYFLRMLWETTGYTRKPLNLTGSFFAGYLLYTSFLGLGADLQILVTYLAVYLVLWAMDHLLHLLRPNAGKAILPENDQRDAPIRLKRQVT
ncbi:MAG: hypothetical protein R2787_08610 [Saprospiraceae bacterium]